MKRFLLIIMLISTNSQNNATCAITYDFSGGRFGDSLLAYLHAKWLSFIHKVPLIYRPFEYSDQLALHVKEMPIHEYSIKNIRHLSQANLAIDTTRDCTYMVPYFAEVLSEHRLPGARHWIYFAVDWQNKEFKDQICSLIKPIDSTMTHFSLPTDKITVALHVRKGGGYDNPLLSDVATTPDHPYSYYSDYYSMLKFPPEFFFVEQLKIISELFNNEPIYAFIFTDDRNPLALSERFYKQLQDYPNIELDYRKENNRHNSNVLEDFFALTQFDCLIRPQSNFSLIAAKIADYKIEIYPTECHWEGKTPFIDNVEMIKNTQTN